MPSLEILVRCATVPSNKKPVVLYRMHSRPDTCTASIDWKHTAPLVEEEDDDMPLC